MALAAGPLRDQTSRPDLLLSDLRRRRRRPMTQMDSVVVDCSAMMPMISPCLLRMLLLRNEHDCRLTMTLTHISWRECPLQPPNASQAVPAVDVLAAAARPSDSTFHRRMYRECGTFDYGSHSRQCHPHSYQSTNDRIKYY